MFYFAVEMAHSMNLTDEINSCTDSSAVCTVLETRFTPQAIQKLTTVLIEAKRMLSHSRKNTKEKKSVIPQFLEQAENVIELANVMRKLPNIIRTDLAKKDLEKIEVDIMYEAKVNELQFMEQQRNIFERYR